MLDFLNVSRETIELLDEFALMVLKWNSTINLVSKATTDHIWRRHIVDSAQIFPLAAPCRGSWVDLGTGGGFPGMVIAIIAKELSPELDVIFVESDRRKSAFLHEAGRRLGVMIDVRAERVDSLPCLGADVISARALAPLSELLSMSVRHLRPNGMCIFHKGVHTDEEFAAARELWNFDVEVVPSRTDETGKILIIREIASA